jgi:histidinol-phosphatase
MTEGADDLALALALALDLADQADAITVPRFGALDLHVDTKPDLTPVTDADRSVETALRETLAARRPGDSVLGEEFGGTTQFSGRQWVIDPIDGTKNFVRGVPVWATLIGLLVEGRPVAGVVSAPALQRRWWAADGQGAYAAAGGGPARRLSVSAVGQLSSASLSFSSLSGWAERGLRDRFIELTDAVWRVRAYGDFYSYCLVAEGAVDIAAEPEVSLWDLAPLDVLVREAGGTFTGLDGAAGPHGGSAVATNGLLHEAVLTSLYGG